MNWTNETNLAWAMADSAAQYIAPAAHSWLCVQIGAGDQARAIEVLLAFFAYRGIAIQKDLIWSLRLWIRGYAGSDQEALLRKHFERLMASIDITWAPASVRR